MIGGEGGIRTFGVSYCFNRLRMPRVRIVSKCSNRSFAEALGRTGIRDPTLEDRY
jgi:hypothetical protein